MLTPLYMRFLLTSLQGHMSAAITKAMASAQCVKRRLGSSICCHTSGEAPQRDRAKFCVLQVVTVFLGSFITGSFFNEAKQLINAPTSIITTLGTSAPLTSIFFLTFIELNVRFHSPCSLL